MHSLRDRVVVCCCCCRHSSGIKHFNIERTPRTFYLKDIQFTTIDQLVQYYSHTDVPNKELIRGVRLRLPITRATPITSNIGNMSPEHSGDSTGADVYIHPVCIIRISCHHFLAFSAQACNHGVSLKSVLPPPKNLASAILANIVLRYMHSNVSSCPQCILPPAKKKFATLPLKMWPAYVPVSLNI